jgi:hypothetical protein
MPTLPLPSCSAVPTPRSRSERNAGRNRVELLGPEDTEDTTELASLKVTIRATRRPAKPPAVYDAA